MFSLILSILSSGLIALIMRFGSARVKNPLGMLLANYLVCTALGVFYTDFQLYLPQTAGYFPMLGMSLLNGAIYLGAFVMYQRVTMKSGIVLASIFMKLGLLVPMVLSVFLFREYPNTLQILGFLLAVFSIFLINYSKDATKSRLNLGLIPLLLLGGSADAMSKVYQVLGTEALSNQFLFFTYGTALVLCSCLMLLRKGHFGLQEMLYGGLIGIPNFFCTKFMLAALNTVPAVVAYPTFSVSTMLLVTLVGIVLFREKLNKHQWCALGIILISLALLNL